VLDDDFVLAAELAHAPDNLDLALFGHASQAAGQFADHRVLEVSKLVEVDVRLAERHAMFTEMRGRVDHLADVQERLGGDAADIQADPADRAVALDQRDLQTQVGGAEGRRVAGWPGAEHGQVEVVVVIGRIESGFRFLVYGFRAGLVRLSGTTGCFGILRVIRSLPGTRFTFIAGVVIVRRFPAAFGNLHDSNDVAFSNLVTFGDFQLDQLACRRRRHVHRRLVRLQRNQRLFLLDIIALVTQHLDHRLLAEIADIGDGDLASLAHALLRCCPGPAGRPSRKP